MASSNLLVFKTPDGSKSDVFMDVDGETSIGRHPDCTLTVSQPSVSRRHARLWFESGEWHVEDLQSSNGTYVNNRRISESTITEGDEVRCGDFVLTYVVRAEEKSGGSSNREPPALPPSPPAPPPRVVGKLSAAGDMPPPPPAVADRATIGLDESADFESNVALLDVQNERDELAQEIEALKNKASSSQRESDQKDSEIEDLQGNVEALEADLSGLRAELASVRSQIDGNQSHTDEALSSSREELATVRDEMDALRQTNAQLRSDLEAAETRASNAEDDERTRVLEGELASAEEARAAAQQERDTAQAELEESQTELSEVRSALVKAEEANSATVAEQGSVTAELSEDLDELSSELRDQLMLAKGLLNELSPLVDATEEMRKDGLPGNVGTSIKNVVEQTDGAHTMGAAQTAVTRAESLIRSLRRMARQIRESS